MMRILFLFTFCSLLFVHVQAQELYQPRNIKQAYEKRTRSQDGKPGENYWKNTGNCTIHITTPPPNRTIRGAERITYFNNSPDSLNALIFKLFLNNHKPGAPRNGGATEDYLTSGVHVDSLTINGNAHEWGELAVFYMAAVAITQNVGSRGFDQLVNQLAFSDFGAARP